MYAVDPVLDGTELNYIASSLCDDTVYCALTKLASPSFGYTSIVCPGMTANAKAILGNNLPSDMLFGTCWETDEDTTYCIASMPSYFIVPMHGTIVPDNITDTGVFERWVSLGQDHAEYLTHIKMARSNKSDINKVFRLIAGSETN